MLLIKPHYPFGYIDFYFADGKLEKQLREDPLDLVVVKLHAAYRKRRNSVFLRQLGGKRLSLPRLRL